MGMVYRRALLIHQVGLVRMSLSMTTKLGYAGFIALAVAIPDMSAILSVNLLKNDIGIDQAQALVSILKGRPILKSLCGNTGEETALNMRGKMGGADDTTMLAVEIVNNGALLVLS
jgi:hypothetical protein